jgi:hypothetical protein
MLNSAASVAAQVLRVGVARLRTSAASRIVSRTVPTFKPPRSSSLDPCTLAAMLTGGPPDRVETHSFSTCGFRELWQLR